MPVVKQWMTRPVLTIPLDTRIGVAAGVMKARRVRHLPVVNGDGRLVGIVTDRDVRQVIFRPSLVDRVEGLRATLAALTVRDVMTWSVITVRPETDLREAARLMHERKFGALPVVDDGKVVGMLTEHDALAALEQLLAAAPRPDLRRPRTIHAPPVLGPRTKAAKVRPLAAGRTATSGYDYGFPQPEWRDGHDEGEGD